MTKLQAMGGVGTEYPKNSMTAFIAAQEQKYDSVFLEVERTADGMWRAKEDASPIRLRPKFVDAGAAVWEEVLKLAKTSGMKVRIGSSWEAFDGKQKEDFFQMLQSCEECVALTCGSLETVAFAAKISPNMKLQYDGPVTGEILKQLSELDLKKRPTVWLSLEQAKQQAELVKAYADLGIGNLQKYDQLEEAEQLGADVVSTPGQLKAAQNEGLLSDMHTHSRNSMDANVPVLDLCQGEIEGGARIVAITEHEEMQWLDTRKDYDMDAFLLGADKEIQEVRKELGDAIDICQGIELGQAAWYPKEADRLIHLLPFDIIVGCVHEIRDPSIEDKVAAITPWQSYFKPEFEEKRGMFWEQYFEENLKMVQSVDVDSVAHLGFVARTAKSRLGEEVDLHPYEAKIRQIFQVMIENGIALEINSHCYETLEAFVPCRWMVELYRDMGGYLLTLASDAHGASDPCNACFRQVADQLKEMGFHNIFYYKNRRSYPCTL